MGDVGAVAAAAAAGGPMVRGRLPSVGRGATCENLSGVRSDVVVTLCLRPLLPITSQKRLIFENLKQHG